MREPDLSRAPNMVDVAKFARVGLVTVSRVVNGNPSVRPETAERVRSAIATLGYRRNDVARALKSGRSMTIGVVVAGSGLFELSRVLLGMEVAASEAGYGVALARWQGPDLEPLEHAIGRMTDRGAAGVIVIAERPVAADVLDQMHVRSPLTVVMSGDVANPSVGSVEIDQRLGARMVTEHLLALGHTKILHISGSSRAFDSRARVTAWRASMRDAGLRSGELIEGGFEPEVGYRVGEELARRGRGERPTAVFAANDVVAMGLLAAFAEHGVRVPDDVSVAGFDDMPGAAYLVPSLTTVHQDHLGLGRRAVEVLLGTIAADESPRHHVIAPELIVRRSTGPIGHEARDAPKRVSVRVKGTATGHSAAVG